MQEEEAAAGAKVVAVAVRAPGRREIVFVRLAVKRLNIRREHHVMKGNVLNVVRPWSGESKYKTSKKEVSDGKE